MTAVKKQFPTTMPALFPGSKATDARSCASFDAMSRACSELARNTTRAVNGEKRFLYLFLRRKRGHPPRRGPGPPVIGAVMTE